MITHLRKGFTLMELMIVIAIIGVLAAALFPAYADHVDRAIFAGQLKSMLDMKTAIELYETDNGDYPHHDVGWANPYGCYGSTIGQYTENNWIPGLISGGYITNLPDPQSGSKNCASGNFFIYGSPSGNHNYKLLSHGQRMAKYVVHNRLDLLDPKRDGGTNIYLTETGSSLIPWAWGFWTSDFYAN